MSASEQPALDIRYVAALARLELSDEEAATYQEQLAGILDYMKKIDELDVGGIEPTAHANPVMNVLRQDEERPGLTQEEVLSNAPKALQGQFGITKVVD